MRQGQFSKHQTELTLPLKKHSGVEESSIYNSQTLNTAPTIPKSLEGSPIPRASEFSVSCCEGGPHCALPKKPGFSPALKPLLVPVLHQPHVKADSTEQPRVRDTTEVALGVQALRSAQLRYLSVVIGAH